MMRPEERDWLAFAAALAQESASILRDATAARPDAEVKADRSFVTALDARIERRLRELIADRFPTHGIIGEEEAPINPDAELTWVLDPIDGTAAFIAGMPVYGTLIALLCGEAPILGLMDHPATGDRWVGFRGQPTTRNERPVRVRACGSLSTAIVSASNPDFFDAAESRALDAMREATAWRIWGGACMSYGLLASGRIDGAIDTSLKLWDFAPFRPIIEGAGGVITDWEGRPLGRHSGKRVLAAGDPARHRDALRLVDRAMTG